MMIASIILFLLTASTVSLFLHYKGVRLAYIWMVLFITTSIVWLLLIIIQPENISPFVVRNWMKIGSTPVDLTLKINNFNWPIGVSYFTILVSYLLTSIVRLQSKKSLFAWVEMTVLVISGWLILLAGDYWSILIAWTLIDFVEILFTIRYKMLDLDRFYFHFLSKFIGSMLLVFGISRSYQVNLKGLFGNNIQGVWAIILLAAILHSGILFNSHKKSSKSNYSQISLIFLRIISFTSSFYVLTYISDHRLGFISEIIIKIIFAVVAIWGAYRWALESNENDGIQNLLIAFGAMIGYLYLAGTGEAIIYWLIILLLPIGWLFFYTDRDLRIGIFWFFSVFMMSGLPFSLTFLGINEFLINKNSIDLFFMALPMTIVMSGYIKYVSKKRGRFNYLEPLYQIFYLIGLFLPLISMSAVVLKNIQFSADALSGWWVGLIVLSLSITAYYYITKSRNQNIKVKKSGEVRIGSFTTPFQWVQIVFEKTHIIFESFLTFTSKLFEGAGGILWAVVFLALFLTILKFQGGN